MILNECYVWVIFGNLSAESSCNESVYEPSGKGVRQFRKERPSRQVHPETTYRMPCITHDLLVKVRPWEFGSSPT